MRSLLARLPGAGRVAQTLGLNSVPVAGVFAQGWSSGTALALYWLESALVIGLVAARIALHRRRTRKAGHWRAPHFTTPGRFGSAGSLLGSYVRFALPFTVLHGVFLGTMLALVTVNRPDLDLGIRLGELATGVAAVAALLFVGFLLDLVGLGERPFRWVERIAERALGRVFVVHATIVFGLLATAWTDGPAGLFAVFAGLKTAVELGALFPERDPALGPPRWLRFLDRAPGPAGETFSDSWRKVHARRTRFRVANERVRPAA
jgi:hypothetical protein